MPTFTRDHQWSTWESNPAQQSLQSSPALLALCPLPPPRESNSADRIRSPGLHVRCGGTIGVVGLEPTCNQLRFSVI